MESIDPGIHDVIVFAPFAGVKLHARLERRVAEALHFAGANVLFISCSGLLNSRCVVMESMELDPGTSDAERRAICAACARTATQLDDRVPSRLTKTDIASLLDQEAAGTATRVLSAFHQAPSPDFEWEGVPLGAFWCYETILKYKSEERSPQFLAHLEEVARSGSLAFAVAQRLAQSSSATAVLVHSSQYGVNRSFVYPFVEYGASVYTFYNAGQYSRWEEGFRIERVGPNGVTVRHTTPQEVARQWPLVATELDGLKTWTDDRVGQRGAHTYSTARTHQSASAVRVAFGIDNRPVVVAFSSSPDERHAGSTAQLLHEGAPPFDPLEHYRFAQLVSDTARVNPETTFLYRLHPRLAANRRDSRRSPHLDKLIALVESPDRPSNLILNSPEQEVSLYELAMIADVGLNWSSSAGLEFLMLGIPVVGVLETPVSAYPPDLNFEQVAGDVTLLSKALREAVGSDWSVDTMRAAARWVIGISSRTVVPVSLGASAPDPAPTMPHKAFARLPGGLRRVLRPLAVRVRAIIARRVVTDRSDVPTNRADRPDAIAVEGRTWEDLLDSWVDWSEVPPIASPQTEEDVLRGLAAHLVERLAPWDGTEGAVRGLHQFANEQRLT